MLQEDSQEGPTSSNQKSLPTWVTVLCSPSTPSSSGMHPHPSQLWYWATPLPGLNFSSLDTRLEKQNLSKSFFEALGKT